MTIAVTVQVMDGLVMAADSASTIPGAQGVIENTYDHANKIVNLCKGKPVGAMFYGMGAIGRSSMSTLAKDLRRRFSGEDPEHEAWALEGDEWTVHGIAQRVKEFFYEERYLQEYTEGTGPDGGIMIGGYTPGKDLSEQYELLIAEDRSCAGPDDEYDGDSAMLQARGQPDAIMRLVWGFAVQLPDVLVDQLGLPAEHRDDAASILRGNLEQPPVHPAMPIQDAVDLADFMVDLTKKWVRFQPGAPTVGGPTELAAITKHEGFKWVDRKFYFQPALNPDD